MITFQKDISLKAYNTFGLDVKTKYFFPFTSIDQLKSVLTGIEADQELLVLGGGSNLLFTKDFNGLVLKNELKGVSVLKEDNAHIWVKAMAGENWHQFVLHCINQGWAGVENLSLIPGTVGAAPMQNIGAYGIEIKEVFESLEAINIETRESETFDKEKCQFGYRESIFKKAAKGKYIITSVIFRLNKVPTFNVSYGAIQNTLKEMGISELTIKAVSDAVIRIRQSKLPDPSLIGNAGSFFKNPSIGKANYELLLAKYSEIPGYNQADDTVKVPAAWLIEQAGWKGKTFGEIGVHKNQPLVLVNYGNGNGSMIRQLAMNIQSSVKEKFGIQLTPEVNII